MVGYGEYLDVKGFVIQDSDSTLDTLSQVNVLVKFALPQVLCQLTDLDGAVHTTAAAGATSMQVKSFTDAEIVEVGEIFTIADHRKTYIVTTELTLANQASTGSTLAFYPPLESAATADDVITFVKSSLLPIQEDLLERMVGSYAIQSDMMKYVKSGAPLVRNLQAVTNNNPRLNSVLIQQDLESLSMPEPGERYTRE